MAKEGGGAIDWVIPLVVEWGRGLGGKSGDKKEKKGYGDRRVENEFKRVGVKSMVGGYEGKTQESRWYAQP